MEERKENSVRVCRAEKERERDGKCVCVSLPKNRKEGRVIVHNMKNLRVCVHGTMPGRGSGGQPFATHRKYGSMKAHKRYQWLENIALHLSGNFRHLPQILDPTSLQP